MDWLYMVLTASCYWFCYDEKHRSLSWRYYWYVSDIDDLKFLVLSITKAPCFCNFHCICSWTLLLVKSIKYLSKSFFWQIKLLYFTRFLVWCMLLMVMSFWAVT
jgi:hypothetical protein